MDFDNDHACVTLLTECDNAPLNTAPNTKTHLLDQQASRLSTGISMSQSPTPKSSISDGVHAQDKKVMVSTRNGLMPLFPGLMENKKDPGNRIIACTRELARDNVVDDFFRGSHEPSHRTVSTPKGVGLKIAVRLAAILWFVPRSPYLLRSPYRVHGTLETLAGSPLRQSPTSPTAWVSSRHILCLTRFSACGTVVHSTDPRCIN